MKIFLIVVSGGVGALARYGLSGLVHRITDVSYPIGTFVVNVVGCFLFGLIWALAEDRLLLGGDARAIILVGFMGSFTTFSTFIFESNELLRDSQFFLAGVNLVGQVALGIVALYLGFFVAKLFGFK